ncbi:MAG TPA: MBL fold metallo-hydrolase, partial [Hadesarchaea archaeon]|nr:MBL fold metallo-hydrolase [Hadesarchaea archaeon]
MGKLTFEPVWFDSLGAKSSCTLVCTPDISVLIDPGVAVMQPSFPASWAKKLYWGVQGMRAIKRAGRKADAVVISHYHYDHFTDFDRELYEGK